MPYHVYFCAISALSIALHCFTAMAAPQTELPTAAQCNDVIQSTLPSIVQLNFLDRDGIRHCYGCGVIVSPEGHVVASGMIGAVLDNVRLSLRLTDGRQVTGEALGWSNEFNIGMFKITDPGKWPIVECSDQIEVGDLCLSLGYSLESAGEHQNDRPEARLGVVDRVAKDSWFTTPSHNQLTPHPVFNLNGKLIGLAVGDYSSASAGEFTIHQSASLIRAHWDELVAGLDIDRKRFVEPTKPLELDKMGSETLDAVKAATVQIGEIGGKPSFSGVIVHGGFIVSCAHHHRLPGSKFNVVLSDGRSIVARLVNSNWLTDICVLEVIGEEDLPVVNFGYSARLSPGDTIVTVGYPHRNEGKAIVLETTLAKDRTSTRFRDMVRDEIYSDGADEEIAKGLSGVSGGGVFDSAGNLIGIHKGLVSAGARLQLNTARIELFRCNWETLVEFEKVDAIGDEETENVSLSLNKLMLELTINDSDDGRTKP